MRKAIENNERDILKNMIEQQSIDVNADISVCISINFV